ncbi:hypothetical protein GOBAR_AA03921 [Gossypium barbadense]|uniref:Uncharacterized protein n=1 Tax=Gossypium barbadense TaxID=3634 RepID=A0A2P5YM49_GOSBA|nr:hypothetical protein GOBAR_AA03921 [Gossypium barbadense]
MMLTWHGISGQLKTNCICRPQPAPGTSASAVHHLIHPLVHLSSTTCSSYWHFTVPSLKAFLTDSLKSLTLQCETSGGQPKLMPVTAQVAKKWELFRGLYESPMIK